MVWIRGFVFLVAVLVAGNAWAQNPDGGAFGESTVARPDIAKLSVGVYVNVDEMAALWPYRDGESGDVPRPGDEGFPAYKERWQNLVQAALKEIRRRVPRHIPVLPATGPTQDFAVKISIWIADIATHCSSPEFYKYIWVRTQQSVEGVATNWEGLGVKSQTLLSTKMDKATRARADLDSWVELWSKVPYLHLLPAEQKEALPLEPQG